MSFGDANSLGNSEIRSQLHGTSNVGKDSEDRNVWCVNSRGFKDFFDARSVDSNDDQ